VLEIEINKFKWALSTLLKVATTNHVKKADTGISLLLRSHISNGTSAYLATPGWAYSTSAVYDLGEVSPAACGLVDTTVPTASWKMLATMLRKVKTGNVVIEVDANEDSRVLKFILPDGNVLPMRGNDVVYAGLLPENYEVDKEYSVAMKTVDLQTALSNAVVSTPKVDDWRPALTCAQITFNQEGMLVYSSDGRRLTRVSSIPVTRLGSDDAPLYEMAMRRPLCNWLCRLKGLDKHIVLNTKISFVGHNSNTAVGYQGFSVGALCVYYLKSEYHFPDFSRTIPKDEAVTGSWTLPREEFLRALRSASMTYATLGHDKDDYFPYSVLSYSAEDSSMRVRLLDNREQVWNVRATQTGNPPDEIVFNADYLVEWLSNQNVENVVLDITDEVHAARMYPLNDMGNMYVVMPVRLAKRND
jgi:hypothetical protein